MRQQLFFYCSWEFLTWSSKTSKECCNFLYFRREISGDIVSSKWHLVLKIPTFLNAGLRSYNNITIDAGGYGIGSKTGQVGHSVSVNAGEISAVSTTII